MSLRISVPDQDWADRLADLAAVEVLIWDESSAQPEGRLDLMLRPYQLDSSALATFDTSRIGLIQSQSLGYDGVEKNLPPHAVYANVVGVHEGSTAELAMALLLASVRGVDGFARAHQWDKQWTPGLQGQRVGLIGVGGIGSELHQRLDGFGCEIVRVASAGREDELGIVHSIETLDELLVSFDAVVVAVPLTDSTVHLIDDRFLAALPEGSTVVNVSRGRVADTDAIVRAAGRIHYASDVFDPEPLPDDHPLWQTPNTLITPNVGGMTTSMRDRVETIVRDQVARIQQQLEPLYVVVRT